MKSIAQGDILSACFDPRHTVYMTGASFDQLYRWRKEGLIEPEYPLPQCPYSFRDLVVIRLAAYLRSQHSMPVVREVITSLDRPTLNKDPENYTVEVPGRTMNLTESFRPFTNLSGRSVRDFEQPFTHIAFNPNHRGGWPSFNGTRKGYDFLASVTSIEDIMTGRYEPYIPGVPRLAMLEAHALMNEVESLRNAA